jgi:hypothetical protein
MPTATFPSQHIVSDGLYCPVTDFIVTVHLARELMRRPGGYAWLVRALVFPRGASSYSMSWSGSVEGAGGVCRACLLRQVFPTSSIRDATKVVAASPIIAHPNHPGTISGRGDVNVTAKNKAQATVTTRNVSTVRDSGPRTGLRSYAACRGDPLTN